MSYLARTAPDELEDPVTDPPKPKAFRVEDVARPTFFELHRAEILAAMARGHVLPRGADVPAGVELVERELHTFTRAQVMDPAFYAEHRDHILEAVADGRITNDRETPR